MDFRSFSAILFLIHASFAYVANKKDLCRTVDAAIRYNDINYLFVGPDYITLDDDNKEVDIGNKHDEWGGLGRLDAALMWKDGDSWYDKWYPIFFEAATYSYYSSWRGSTYGPYDIVYGDNDDEWNSELNLMNGVDAATSVGHLSYLMKFCNYVVFDHDKREVIKTGSFEGTAIPCNLHAAIEVSDTELGVLKYDQMWVFDVDSHNITGPHDVNKVLKLKSLRLCTEHEDAGISVIDMLSSEEAGDDNDGDKDNEGDNNGDDGESDGN